MEHWFKFSHLDSIDQFSSPGLWVAAVVCRYELIDHARVCIGVSQEQRYAPKEKRITDPIPVKQGVR
jgi:hypothetical protein